MKLVIVGSVALDDVKTPHGAIRRGLGGSAVYASLAASQFVVPGIVGVVGEDFPDEHLALLKRQGIALDGLERAAGKTFHWSGYYTGDMNEAHTVATELNVFAAFKPRLPREWRDAPFVFLANIDPDLQNQVLDQMIRPSMVVLDTMNLWIENKREQLLRVMKRADLLVVNEGEARLLSGEPNVVRAGRWLMRRGPRGVAIKRGACGAMVMWGKETWLLPAYPVDEVKDPTGAGDTFAGGLIGILAQGRALTAESLRRAVAVGTVLAAHTVEAFSVQGLTGLKAGEVQRRYRYLASQRIPSWTLRMRLKQRRRP
ncbi:MAG: PfkB family carbohydrate kinase [candidate division FCPU426 bacterium]